VGTPAFRIITSWHQRIYLQSSNEMWGSRYGAIYRNSGGYCTE
jgi:hypothetical protein